MGKDKANRGRPATSPEQRESQLISLAYDLAEKQLRDGTASAQVITNFLKLGSSREKLEQAKIQQENLVLSGKVEAMEAARRIEVLYEEALKAMKSYAGQDIVEYDDD